MFFKILRGKELTSFNKNKPHFHILTLNTNNAGYLYAGIFEDFDYAHSAMRFSLYMIYRCTQESGHQPQRPPVKQFPERLLWVHVAIMGVLRSAPGLGLYC